MQLNFRNIALVCALICFTLAVMWLFAPHVLLGWGQIDSSYAAGLIGRRSAALFFGVAIMFFWARNSEPSRARSALAYGFAAACLGLAGLGLYEYFTAHLGPAIFLAIIVEFILALLLLWVANKK